MKPKQQPVIALIASMMLLALPAWADGEADGGNLPNIRSTPCTAQPDGHEWTNKKTGETFVCQKGISVLKGSNVKPNPKPCKYSDVSCDAASVDKGGQGGGSGSGSGSGVGSGSGNGSGVGSGSGNGSGVGSGSGNGSGGGSSSGNGSGGVSSSGNGSGGGSSGNEVQSSGSASTDGGSGARAGSSSGSGSASAGGSADGGAGVGGGAGGYADNSEYLKALREWGKRWAEYFKSLSEREQAIQTGLTKSLSDCLRLWGASSNGELCSQRVIESSEKEKKNVEKLRQDGIARAAKEKAAINAMKPRPAPNVPMPNGGPNGGGNGGNGGNGDNITNNNNTTINNNTNTTVNNNTNVTNNGGSGGSGKSGSNGNDGKGNDANDGKGDKGNPDGKPDGEEKGETLSEYCKNNSNALSCVKLGDQEDIEKSLQGGKGKDKGRPFGMGEHEIGIPQINRSHDFVESGVCPAPKQVMILGAMQEFSYQPMCDMAIKIRPAVILSAILLAFFIVQAAISRA